MPDVIDNAVALRQVYLSCMFFSINKLGYTLSIKCIKGRFEGTLTSNFLASYIARCLKLSLGIEMEFGCPIVFRYGCFVY